MSGMWIGIASLVLTVAGAAQQKKAIKADAAFSAQEQIAAALRSRAVGQRNAAGERKQARLVSSTLQARAMGGGQDPGVVELEKDIAGEGEYRALAALYAGDDEALGLERAAAAGGRSARARSRAVNYSTAGTILEGSSRMYNRYADNRQGNYGSGSYNAPQDYTQANSGGAY